MDVEPLVVAASAYAHQKLGIESLYEFQCRVLGALGQGKDVLTVVPTGAGKSLCYLIPSALHEAGLVVVISPLVALMREQAERYAARGFAAASLHSHQSPDEQTQVWLRLERAEIRLLFISAERFALPAFRARLKSQQVWLVAVDEAHCLSQWGDHFRLEYARIGRYLDEDFPVAQRLALSATSSTLVREDITQKLGLREPHLEMACPIRENLKIKVLRSSTKHDHLTMILQSVLNAEGAGIIYAPTRARVDDIWQMLENAGVEAERYHAGLTQAQRGYAQKAFEHGRCRVLVATNAFGMGMDKADIRFVFHAGLPGAVESYMQEMGRAGRDGLEARCYLFFVGSDYHIHKFRIENSYPKAEALEKNLFSIAADEMAAPSDLLAARYAEHLALMYGKDWPANIPQFVQKYALRRAEEFARLSQMYQYANLKHGFQDFLKSALK